MDEFQMNRRRALRASGLGILSLGMPGVVMSSDQLGAAGNAVAAEKSCLTCRGSAILIGKVKHASIVPARRERE